MATIEQNLTQLIQDKDDLVTNLTSKGITGLTGNETFTELVPEVLNISSGSGHDWSAIGYSEDPLQQTIQDGYDYAMQIKNNWVTSTSYASKFREDRNLVFMPIVDTSSGTNFSYMFAYCTSLTTIPQLDTSNGTNFTEMFNNCTVLTTIPQLNTSSGTRFDVMFSRCYLLTTIPQLDTSGCTDFHTMFYQCYSLTTIPQLDTSKGNDISYMFSGCSNLTNLGGLKDLGKAYLTTQSANYSNYTLSLSACNKLTHDSLMNVINNLYDIATAGVQTQKLVLGSTNLAKLTTEEIAIATNKG